jgi:tetrahydromethanopterin S-methyltransferase subunit G
MSEYSSSYDTTETDDLDDLVERIKVLEKKLQNNTIKQNIQKKIYDKIMKYIKILYGYSDMIYNQNQIYIYGELLENLIRKKNIKNNTLNIFFENLSELYLIQFVENLYNLGDIVNENYKCNNKISTINGVMSFFQLKIKLDPNYHIYVNIHNECFKDDPLFNTQNIVLTKDGLTIKQFTNFELKKNYKYKSLGLLDNLVGNIYNKTSINYFSNQFSIDELFDHLDSQNELIKKGFDIEKGYIIDKNPNSYCGICLLKHLEENNVFLYELECSHSFCSECLEKSMNTDLNNRYNCPVCRQNITVKIKK